MARSSTIDDATTTTATIATCGDQTATPRNAIDVGDVREQERDQSDQERGVALREQRDVTDDRQRDRRRRPSAANVDPGQPMTAKKQQRRERLEHDLQPPDLLLGADDREQAGHPHGGDGPEAHGPIVQGLARRARFYAFEGAAGSGRFAGARFAGAARLGPGPPPPLSTQAVLAVLQLVPGWQSVVVFVQFPAPSHMSADVTVLGMMLLLQDWGAPHPVPIILLAPSTQVVTPVVHDVTPNLHRWPGLVSHAWLAVQATQLPPLLQTMFVPQ